jgi:hypothetical protein
VLEQFPGRMGSTFRTDSGFVYGKAFYGVAKRDVGLPFLQQLNQVFPERVVRHG